MYYFLFLNELTCIGSEREYYIAQWRCIDFCSLVAQLRQSSCSSSSIIRQTTENGNWS